MSLPSNTLKTPSLSVKHLEFAPSLILGEEEEEEEVRLRGVGRTFFLRTFESEK